MPHVSAPPKFYVSLLQPHVRPSRMLLHTFSFTLFNPCHPTSTAKGRCKHPGSCVLLLLLRQYLLLPLLLQPLATAVATTAVAIAAVATTAAAPPSSQAAGERQLHPAHHGARHAAPDRVDGRKRPCPGCENRQVGELWCAEEREDFT